MKIIPQKLSTRAPTVTVINPEERTLGPDLVLPMLRLHYVENYTDAVLVVVSDETLIRIRRVGPNNTVAFKATFGRLMVRDDDPSARLQGQCRRCLRLIIFVYHLVSVEYGQTLDVRLVTR